MNKLLLLSLCTAASLTAAAQPTLTSSVLPISGDMVTGLETFSITNPGPAGANVNWNFTGFTYQQGDTSVFVACPMAPGCADFTGSTLAAGTPTADVYTHFKADAQGISLLGYYDTGVPYVYDDPEDLLRLPITYQNSYTDNFGVTFDYGGGIIIRRKGQTAVTADAYGTLILPNGTYANVLRVKLVEDFTDSSAASPVSAYHVEQYNWYQAGVRNPIMTFAAYSSSIGPTAYHAQYRDNGTTAITQSALQVDNIKIFPNPAADVLTLSLPAGIVASGVSIAICDVTGRYVQAPAVNNAGEIKITTAALPAGFYLLQLYTQDGTQTVKFNKL